MAARLRRASASGCSYALSAMPNGRSTRSAITSGNARPVTSHTSCCTTVEPPPEYCTTVPGAQNDSTAGVTEPPTPDSRSGTLGTGVPSG